MKKYPLLFFSILIIAIFFVTLVFVFQPSKPSKSPLELKIAAFDGPYSGLIFYANHLGLFQDENLLIDYALFDSGVKCAEYLLAQKADLATGAEFVGVSFFEQDNHLRILASIAEGDVIQIIYHDDVSLSSTETKKIGLKINSQADFFFQRYLIYNDLPGDRFHVFETDPVEMSQKLNKKELDGVVVWEPFVYEIINTTEVPLKAESVQANQDFYFLLFTMQSIAEEKHEAIERFIRALVKAQDHREKNIHDFQAFLKERFDYSQEELENTCNRVSFSVSLTQGLINAMESEAQWNMMTGTSEETTFPNYLTVIEPSFLLNIAPDQVFFYQ